ncbi:Os01g0959750, partial [Oryza sativa Japonica Group]
QKKVKQQGSSKEEEGKTTTKAKEKEKKKMSNLDGAGLVTPHFPFHFRPGLL